MASADRPAALLNPDCSAGSILLLPRPTTQGGQQKEVTFHFCLATQEGDTLHIRNFATNSPGVGKKCAWTSAYSKLPLAVPLPLPGLTFIFFLFSLFFSHVIIFVIILIIPEYFISNTARRPIDMVVQTNPNPIHNQENFVPSFDTFCPFAAFQVQNH